MNFPVQIVFVSGDGGFYPQCGFRGRQDIDAGSYWIRKSDFGVSNSARRVSGTATFLEAYAQLA